MAFWMECVWVHGLKRASLACMLRFVVGRLTREQEKEMRRYRPELTIFNDPAQIARVIGEVWHP
eukprot:1191491-Prorocentrum_minimum.AAC.2